LNAVSVLGEPGHSQPRHHHTSEYLPVEVRLAPGLLLLLLRGLRDGTYLFHCP
jgi:hypothetical protein